MLASGYLRVKNLNPHATAYGEWKEEYELELTNFEIRVMFRRMVKSWFDTGTQPSEKEPERFYHGFVLGLMVELADKYVITSNRESGFGRYDIMLEPRAASFNATASFDATASLDAVIIEFKVQEEEEKELSDTVRDALRQIEEKNYQANLIAKGIPEDRIRKYGFAFCGKKVLIG